MGAVYEAMDERLDTTVALKETLLADERLRKQFEREAKLLVGMHDPALPRVSDHFAEGEVYNLRQHLRVHAKLCAVGTDSGAGKKESFARKAFVESPFGLSSFVSPLSCSFIDPLTTPGLSRNTL